MLQHYHHPEPFLTEEGAALPLTIAYATYGRLNEARDNVVWVCHALTASAEVEDWWPGLVGEGCAISPERHFIVCANILGSCYGTTGPLSPGGEDGAPYSSRFPLITIRDMVAAHRLLRLHLGIERIALLAGGSMGGYQVLEWALLEPAVPGRLLLLATAAAESAWGIAIHEAQRMAIEADATWQDRDGRGGEKGLSAARAIGMLTYRNYALFVAQQTDASPDKVDGFRAASYQRYQGGKLARRFHATSYWSLTRSMDSHHLARNRGGGLAAVLERIRQPALVIGISSDLLCPLQEQQFLAAHLPNGTLVEIDSPLGHDGFLVEAEAIGGALAEWLAAQESSAPAHGR